MCCGLFEDKLIFVHIASECMASCVYVSHVCLQVDTTRVMVEVVKATTTTTRVTGQATTTTRAMEAAVVVTITTVTTTTRVVDGADTEVDRDTATMGTVEVSIFVYCTHCPLLCGSD